MPDLSTLKSQARSLLAPNGVMKVGLNVANFLLVHMPNPHEAPMGVAPDLSKAIAQDLGVQLEFVPYATPGDMAAACHSKSWDMALFAVEAAREKDMNFTAAYLEIEATYLVPAGSELQTVADVDRQGVRIALMHKSAYELYLSRTLQKASLVQAPSMDASFEMFVAQKLEALAGLVPKLLQEQAKLPGSRILPGRFTAVQQAIAIPKMTAETESGDSTAKDKTAIHMGTITYLRQFVEAAKASGEVAQLIQKYDVQGVQVAALA